MRSALTILSIACMAAPVLSRADTTSEEWTFHLTPYLWLPTIDGTLNYDAPPAGGAGAGRPRVEVGPADWLELLNFGMLIAGGAQKGRLALHADLIYLRLESDNDGRVRSVEGSITGPGGRITVPVSGQLNLDTNIKLDGLLVTAGVGYIYSETDTSSHIVFAGARYLGIEASTRWNLSAEITGPGGSLLLPAQGSIESDSDLLDGVIGLRGAFRLGKGSWSLPYNLDIGGGTSDLTWSATVALEYGFDWGALVFGYRHLEFDKGDDDLLENFSLSGPGFGARFRF